ncbi:MAG: DUF4197 domain-containing protein [Owenweeksia sp.]|nr:DUF4197 domain-containing protein [Owenweeksia sp.]
MNHGAEKAASRATPIFRNAIKEMSIQDVYNIWQGDNDAATQYLKRTTLPKLREAFRPEIKNALDEVEVTKYWNPVINAYNQLPLTTKVNPNLENYVLEETLNGLFTVIAQGGNSDTGKSAGQGNRTAQKVFGYQDL